MTRLIAMGATAGALLIAGCGGSDDDSSGQATAPAADVTSAERAPTTETGARGTTIQASSSDFGQILFDGEHRAIYLFDREGGSSSECYGDCAKAWPPVLTEGKPVAGKGADGSLLGTTERGDGTTQVTYAGHPLYHYEADPRGQVLCQNVEEFGGLWLVVKP